MRSSLSLGAALLLTIAIIRSCKSEYTCGHLGSGTNACKCGEIVVKSAKVQKPLFYASPEAINEAAVAREAVGRLSVGTDRWHGSENLASTPKYESYTDGAFSSSSSSSSSSISSSSSSRSSSSIGILGGSIGGSNDSPFTFVSDRVTSNCGCGKGRTESLEVRDLLSSNIEGKVVPSFPPIGDLCYPSPPSSKFQVTTKVTPAYPGKIKCAPPIPYKVCVKILNGQIDEAGLRELGLTTGGSIGGSASIFDKYISNGAAKLATRYGSHASAGAGSTTYGSYSGGNAGSIAYGSYAGAGAGSSTYGSYSGANAGSIAYGSHAGAGAGSTTYGSYSGANAGSTAYTGIGRSSNVERIQGSSRSDYDFGDGAELPEDYSYPRLPADPVSVTLAYKNFFPRTVHYNKRAFVPEDKLAFGHRTVPTESTPSKSVPDVPEEKLQILKKPIVELKPIPQAPTIIGAYDEHEEAKLAELEAIEREKINQEEIAERLQENFITYGELGYAPINRPFGQSADPIGVFNNVEDDTRGADCGPVGPPDPDYVPGSVAIKQEEIVRNQVEDDSLRNDDSSDIYVRRYDEISDNDDEEYDNDEPMSGIFARLKSVARKHGRLSSSCGAV